MVSWFYRLYNRAISTHQGFRESNKDWTRKTKVRNTNKRAKERKLSSRKGYRSQNTHCSHRLYNTRHQGWRFPWRLCAPPTMASEDGEEIKGVLMPTSAEAAHSCAWAQMRSPGGYAGNMNHATSASRFKHDAESSTFVIKWTGVLGPSVPVVNQSRHTNVALMSHIKIGALL